jgi:TorA maturation chaperone TorD
MSKPGRKPSLSTLSRLWLREPDAETLAAAAEAGLPGGGTDLAAAWTDLFLLNVYPYGTAFMDVSGELNRPEAARALSHYESAGYRPAELSSAGAPDHAGLCLGFLAHQAALGRQEPEFLGWVLDWLPVCALAVVHQPSVHRFYGGLADATIETLLRQEPSLSSPMASRPPGPAASQDREQELDLFSLIQFLLAPAASGFFLSRSRLGSLALEAGLRLPFASRFETARSLLEAAGECGRVEQVLEGLDREARDWDAAYASLALAHPSWRSRAAVWRGRLAATRERLARMGEAARGTIPAESGREFPGKG